MGFWDVAKNVAAGAVEMMNEKAQEYAKLREKMEGKSDDELADIMCKKSFFSNPDAQRVAFAILKDRGWDAGILREMMKK